MREILSYPFAFCFSLVCCARTGWVVPFDAGHEASEKLAKSAGSVGLRCLRRPSVFSSPFCLFVPLATFLCISPSNTHIHRYTHTSRSGFASPLKQPALSTAFALLSPIKKERDEYKEAGTGRDSEKDRDWDRERDKEKAKETGATTPIRRAMDPWPSLSQAVNQDVIQDTQASYAEVARNGLLPPPAPSHTPSYSPSHSSTTTRERSDSPVSDADVQALFAFGSSLATPASGSGAAAGSGSAASESPSVSGSNPESDADSTGRPTIIAPDREAPPLQREERERPVCLHFLRGHCKYGASCSRAHRPLRDGETVELWPERKVCRLRSLLSTSVSS